MANSSTIGAAGSTAVAADAPIIRGACRGGGAGLVESAAGTGNGIANDGDVANRWPLFAH